MAGGGGTSRALTGCGGRRHRSTPRSARRPPMGGAAAAAARAPVAAMATAATSARGPRAPAAGKRPGRCPPGGERSGTGLPVTATPRPAAPPWPRAGRGSRGRRPPPQQLPQPPSPPVQQEGRGARPKQNKTKRQNPPKKGQQGLCKGAPLWLQPAALQERCRAQPQHMDRRDPWSRHQRLAKPAGAAATALVTPPAPHHRHGPQKVVQLTASPERASTSAQG